MKHVSGRQRLGTVKPSVSPGDNKNSMEWTSVQTGNHNKAKCDQAELGSAWEERDTQSRDTAVEESVSSTRWA